MAHPFCSPVEGQTQSLQRRIVIHKSAHEPAERREEGLEYDARDYDGLDLLEYDARDFDEFDGREFDEYDARELDEFDAREFDEYDARDFDGLDALEYDARDMEELERRKSFLAKAAGFAAKTAWNFIS